MRLKCFFIFVFIIFFAINPVLGQRIFLKDGRIIEGQIIGQSEEQIHIDVNGTVRSFERSDVDSIRESLPSAVIRPQAPEPLPGLQEAEPAPEGPRIRIPVARTDNGLMGLDKRQLILKYMEITGVQGQIRKSFAEIVQNAPESQRQQLRRVLRSEDIVEELVPIYSRYLEEADLRELIRFYESSLGQKLLKTAPLILQETMEKSLEYFQGKIE